MKYDNRVSKYLVMYPLALILMFEEWGWAPLAKAVAKLFRIAHLEVLEENIVHLHPYIALFFLVIPLSLLFPFKIFALFLIHKHKNFLGLMVFIAAKVVGTAITARLFQLTHPTLMNLKWYSRVYPKWKNWKDSVVSKVRLKKNIF